MDTNGHTLLIKRIQGVDKCTEPCGDGRASDAQKRNGDALRETGKCAMIGYGINACCQETKGNSMLKRSFACAVSYPFIQDVKEKST